MNVIEGHSDVVASGSVPVIASARSEPSTDPDRILGFLAVAVFPAVFWMLLLAAGSWLLDWQLSRMALAGTGLAITTFLGLIYGAVSLRAADR